MRVKLNPKDWHYWGRWICAMLFTEPYLEAYNSELVKKMTPSKIGDIMVLHGNYYFLKNDIRRFYDIMIENIQNNTLWFKKFFTLCRDKTEYMLRLENKNNLKVFIGSMIDYMRCGILVELIDFCLEKHLQKVCQEMDISMVVLTIKMHPKKKTELMKYHSELESLNYKNIDNFIDKYKWVGTHALEGAPLNRKKALEALEGFKSKSKKSAIKPSIANIKIPLKLKKLIPIGRELIFHRSNIIETIDRVAFSYRPSMRALGKKHNLTYFDVISLTHYELIDLINKGVIPKDLKKRKKNFGLSYIDGKYLILLGKELKQALNQMQPKEKIKIKEFKGTIAYTGYAVGTVKILQSPKDVSKVKEGDIIVAAETTPDYVLAMRKAGAFITNQGGITSHAAIIAREMKKPCIIGTKIATKVLKDGDLVEVDADKGMVRILDKK